jgi:hypothetical protein
VLVHHSLRISGSYLVVGFLSTSMGAPRKMIMQKKNEFFKIFSSSNKANTIMVSYSAKVQHRFCSLCARQ